jgi:hypothetical protein
MLQQTASRVSVGNLDAADAIIVCNEDHRFLVAEQIRAIGQSGDCRSGTRGTQHGPGSRVSRYCCAEKFRSPRRIVVKGKACITLDE